MTSVYSNMQHYNENKESRINELTFTLAAFILPKSVIQSFEIKTDKPIKNYYKFTEILTYLKKYKN